MASRYTVLGITRSTKASFVAQKGDVIPVEGWRLWRSQRRVNSQGVIRGAVKLWMETPYLVQNADSTMYQVILQCFSHQFMQGWGGRQKPEVDRYSECVTL